MMPFFQFKVMKKIFPICFVIFMTSSCVDLGTISDVANQQIKMPTMGTTSSNMPSTTPHEFLSRLKRAKDENSARARNEFNMKPVALHGKVTDIGTGTGRYTHESDGLRNSFILDDSVYLLTTNKEWVLNMNKGDIVYATCTLDFADGNWAGRYMIFTRCVPNTPPK